MFGRVRGQMTHLQMFISDVSPLQSVWTLTGFGVTAKVDRGQCSTFENADAPIDCLFDTKI